MNKLFNFGKNITTLLIKSVGLLGSLLWNPATLFFMAGHTEDGFSTMLSWGYVSLAIWVVVLIAFVVSVVKKKQKYVFNKVVVPWSVVYVAITLLVTIFLEI